MNRIEEIKEEINEEIKQECIIVKRGRGRPKKDEKDRIKSWKMKDPDYYKNYYHTHTKLKKIEERIEAGLPPIKRGRPKGKIYLPIEKN